jgi:hypothetical protein
MLQGFLKAHGKQACNVVVDGRAQGVGLLEVLLYCVYACHDAALYFYSR